MAGRLSTKVVKAARRLVPLKAPITVTPRAIQKIRDLMVTNPEARGLRVGVKQRGCNGLTYTLEYAKQESNSDEEVKIGDGVKLFLDIKAQMTLLGSEMDYVETKLSSEFVFRNPNIKSTCGCGESFNV
ncbi:unnamed protein product [Soboliphyme baturini]|uniref:Iron-sulfur cluster assembly 1 homolog, mitochondrial n=1 Tax=Soboliphyme baturini TaxID=241478 RepID=A0A183IWH9_9BILA|nr:unnamed protein product [Soboliphyme baturini]